MGVIMNVNLRWGIYKKGFIRKFCFVDVEMLGFYDKFVLIIVNVDISFVGLGGWYLYKSKMVNLVLFFMWVVDWVI